LTRRLIIAALAFQVNPADFAHLFQDPANLPEVPTNRQMPEAYDSANEVTDGTEDEAA
jgi:hypothetical protein